MRIMKLMNCFVFCRSYGGPHTCITYDAVNNAYVQARKYIRKWHFFHIHTPYYYRYLIKRIYNRLAIVF